MLLFGMSYICLQIFQLIGISHTHFLSYNPFLKAFKAYIQGQKLRYRMFRNKLNRINYISKDEKGEVCGISSCNLIEETFIIQEYWGSNKWDR